MERKPRIASVEDPTILAAVRGYFRYEHDWQAREMLDKINSTYLRSKEQDDCASMEFPTVRLWVSGFSVTKDEMKEGYKGHFTRLSIKNNAGKWSLAAEKIPVPLAKHPQKERKLEAHPNWGHPVLRAVETGRKFASIDIARAQLQSLHGEYPDATIPGKDVVHVMIYNRNTDADIPIEKITLRVKPSADGSAKLVVKTETKKPKKKAEAKKPAPVIEVKGSFTAALKEKRDKKKKK